MSISERTRTQALNALDGMAQIVRNEMLVKGEYVSSDVNPDKAGAICGGRRYCAIGSLWAGAGVKAQTYEWGVYLPGAAEVDRYDFLRFRHGLRTAYDALNDAAQRYIDKHDAGIAHYEAPIEALFESNESVGRADLLKIIASAKRTVRGMA